jgi:hypothetical protein
MTPATLPDVPTQFDSRAFVDEYAWQRTAIAR